MAISRRDFLRGAGLIVGTAAAGQLTATALAAGQSVGLDDPALHLLNRLTWGPRPEEVARVESIGPAAFLDEQLAPADMTDDQADRLLGRLPILKMDRRTIYSLSDFEYRSHQALIQGMVLRAVHSRRQLFERMVEFWSDHFNIPSEEFAPDLISFQRAAIRRHTLSNFRDLLIATAKSPAMLRYLDNFVNIAEHPNENYARELLELHTLGVDGGYSETDVREVARAFTGWTIHPRTRSGFYFDGANHDDGAKEILGHRLPAGRGIEDGLHVLSLLAQRRQTAVYICTKLCRRFVSDDPPASLVNDLVTVWQSSQGAIPPVLRTLFLSNEFAAAAGQKLRRPLDFFIGALRATGTEIHHPWQQEELLQRLGQLPYGWHPPNGYPDVAGAWSSTSGLLARWNTAMFLTHGAYSDEEWAYSLTTRLRQRIGQPQSVQELVDAVAAQVFGQPLTPELADPYIAYAADDGPADTAVDSHLLGRKLGSLYGLMLASPLYQWR